MASVRDFFGSNCPACRQDILQAAPSTNRMPEGDCAWCPACRARFSAEDLVGRKKRAGGLLRRIFGGGSTPS